MGFASSWIEERALFPELIREAPDNLTGIICVVPAFNEPGIVNMLDSLLRCREPECKCEVIIVINAPYKLTGEHEQANSFTLNSIESWKKERENSFFRLYYFVAENKEFTEWGVGLARKTGMDEALRRFSTINNTEGVILCLDADCTVQENYFESVCNDFYKKKQWSACSIAFEHPLSGDDIPAEIYRHITLYELHLRYYYQSLLLSGYPWVFHTVGSSMAVKALTYMKAGGMNRKQAGEDFYFIQKHVSSGSYFSLNSTTVYPSPRVSGRVPFGTGASIGKLEEGNSIELMTYNPESFKDLRSLFLQSDTYFGSSQTDLVRNYSVLPESIRSFIQSDELISKVAEINANTSSPDSFRKRFFTWFNMFRIIKYLNHVHSGIYNKVSVTTAASALLKEKGINPVSDKPEDLLIEFRLLERNRNN
jgi:hypothetical protein